MDRTSSMIDELTSTRKFDHTPLISKNFRNDSGAVEKSFCNNLETLKFRSDFEVIRGISGVRFKIA